MGWGVFSLPSRPGISSKSGTLIGEGYGILFIDLKLKVYVHECAGACALTECVCARVYFDETVSLR